MVEPAEGRSRDGLEVVDLHKSYGETVALSGMSLRVSPGRVCGFVGSNGAGKSTTMRIALGVVRADRGEVLLHGRRVDAAVRRRIGYMPEERGLYPKMAVGAQLTYLAELHGLRRQAARRSAEHWAERLGVAQRLGDPVQSLSLGNQQRVQLAAALVHDPDVLVLDEPFSGLDPVAVEVMSGVLRERAEAGAPVLFSSHQLELVERLCDEVAMVRDGRVVVAGPVAELRTSGPAQLVVDAPQAVDGWARGVPGVERVERDGTSWRVHLESAAEDQHVLEAALRTGPVRTFRRHVPTLTELFREVVAA